MKAIIMAGGLGSRLRPLTNEIPKPMVPIIDKPILHYIVKLLAENGVEDVAMTLNYKPQSIINYFGDGKGYGMNIEYFIENRPLGTAGSIKNASEFIDDTFIVISGDAFTNINLREAIKFHKSKKAKLTIIAKEVDNPAGLGVLKVDKNGLVTEFIEKPEATTEKLINTGIYIVEKSVLELIPEGFYDFGKQLLPQMIGELYATTTSSYWCDVGTLNSYYKTNMYVVENPTVFNLEI